MREAFLRTIKIVAAVYFIGIAAFNAAELVQGRSIALNMYKLNALKPTIRFLRPHPKVEKLFAWVKEKTNPGSMFAVPPYDAKFLKFRLVTERAVYVILPDINQLFFDPPSYSEGHRRLELLGVFVPSRQHIVAQSFRHVTCEKLETFRKEGIDYLIVEADAAISCDRARTAYADASYQVIQTAF